MTTHAETHTFQAEVNQVLSIVVNSLYSHKEVFLRELISNASDALDKLSFQSLTDHALLGDDKDLRIEIVADKDQKALLIRDNGIGMTHDELIENLGTIAHSGTKKLVEALSSENKSELSLIGQFGVGFYASFLVADKVTVDSRAAGSDQAWTWQSEAHGEFTIDESDKQTRGTEIRLHLKDDCDDFLDPWQLKSLIRKYSDYVRYPIRLEVEKQRQTDEKDADGNPVFETYREWETVNQANALWRRPKSEITDEQYDEFYKHLSHDWEPPLAHTHFKVEGTQELSGILFVPGHAPFDLFERRSRGIRLYVKRVFIMEDCEELLPEWLRFMRGVIDSEDLPLNVSREILQQDRVTRMIKKQVVSKTLALLSELADEGETAVTTTDDDGNEIEARRDRYETFWSNFGRILKEGIHFSPEHKDELAKLLRYESTLEQGLVSLPDYVARMPSDQPGIYYITGDSIATCRNSPHLEAIRKAGYEVLYMADPVDEWVVQSLTEFDGKKLADAAKGALDLPESEEDKKHMEERTGELQSLLDGMKSSLEDRVSEVRLTNRLTDSPACLVTAEHGLSPHLERILRANGQEVPEQKRILELNPDHPVVQRIRSSGGDDLQRWSRLLFDQALIAEGTMPDDPASFARAVTDLMEKAAD